MSGDTSGPDPTSRPDPTSGIDFASYELDELGADVRSIVSIPGALAQVAKYAFTLPFVIAVVTWLVFNSRIAGWLLVPFSVITFFLAFFAAAVLGGFFVARKRLDTVATASQRIVDVVGEMHADVEQVRDGHASTSVQQVAVGLLENAVFPAVFGTLSATAETALGPFGRLSSSVTKAPMNMVQKSVISAIESLPDREIGQIASGLSEGVSDLTSQYADVGTKIDSIVARVSRTALGSALGLTAMAALPLLAWLVLGWVLS